jgi:hypothetical protein
MPETITITIISDVMTKRGRKLEYKYEDPNTGDTQLGFIRALKNAKQSTIVKRIRADVTTNITNNKDTLNISSLVNRKIKVTI